MIDFHNHLIPGVDDGAADGEQTRAAVLTFWEQGVDRVICTPHVRGEVTRNPRALAELLDRLDRGWSEALEVTADFPAVTLLRGAEVMLDTPEPDLSDPRLRLAETAFVLVEFPFMAVPPNAARALFDLRMAGWAPVLAHPERYANAQDDLADVEEWRRVGGHMQVNSGSLLGRYGGRAQSLAWGLLQRGWADYLSSDYHARGACPVAECRRALAERGAEEQAVLLTEINPQRLLSGQAPLSVPPLHPRRPMWRRVLGLGRE